VNIAQRRQVFLWLGGQSICWCLFALRCACKVRKCSENTNTVLRVCVSVLVWIWKMWRQLTKLDRREWIGEFQLYNFFLAVESELGAKRRLNLRHGAGVSLSPLWHRKLSLQPIVATIAAIVAATLEAAIAACIYHVRRFCKAAALRTTSKTDYLRSRMHIAQPSHKVTNANKQWTRVTIQICEN